MAEALLWIMVVKVRDGCVRSYAVIPECNRTLLPLDPNLEVLPLRDVL